MFYLSKYTIETIAVWLHVLKQKTLLVINVVMDRRG